MLSILIKKALILTVASLSLLSCKVPTRGALLLQDYSNSSSTSFEGIGRWTPYSSEQSGKGSCGDFSQYDSDPKKWAAVSEKFAREQLNFRGCENRGSGESPNCWQIMSKDGKSLCGTKLTVRCDEGRSKSGLCANTNAYSVVLVDICPSDRSYHDWADPDSAGDTACAESYVVDLDESIRVGSGGMLTRKDNPALIIEVGEGDVYSGDSSYEEDSPIESSDTSFSDDNDYSAAPAEESSSWQPESDTSSPSSGGFGGGSSECAWAKYCWGFTSFKWFKNGETSQGYTCKCGLWIKQ